MLESPQANRSYERVRALIALRARYSAHFKPKGNVVDDIAPGEQIQVLPHHDRVSAQRAGTIRMLRVLHANVTGSRRFEPANDLDERALAATTRSEQARETPGTKMMREAVKCFNLGNPLPPDLRHLLDHNIHAKRSYARLYLRTGTKRPQRAPSITITAMTRGGLISRSATGVRSSPGKCHNPSLCEAKPRKGREFFGSRPSPISISSRRRSEERRV